MSDEINEDIRNLRLLYREKITFYGCLLRCAMESRFLNVWRITSGLQDNTGDLFAIFIPDRETI